MSLDPTLDLSKTTPCGRFRVTIESFPQGNVIAVEDAARSLTDLAAILTEASELALQLAGHILTKALQGEPGETFDQDTSGEP